MALTRMTNKKDTLHRMLALLMLIPRYPRRIATPTLLEKLKEQGYKPDVRTLQRNLLTLSEQFPISCDDSEKPHRWYFDQDYHHALPTMDTNEALALVMAEQYLQPLLPSSVLDSLRMSLREAHKKLDSVQANGHSSWRHKVGYVPAQLLLQPAPIDRTVWQEISDALLHHQTLLIQYKKRRETQPTEYLLNPQAIVHRHSVTYLVATAHNETQLKHYALHRMVSAKTHVAEYQPLAGFVLSDYIQAGHFGYATTGKQVTLHALVSPELYIRLLETPLADNQTLTPPDATGWGRLTAKVTDEQSVFWWLQSQGGGIRVLQPTDWGDEIARQAKVLVEWYAEQQVEVTE